MPTGLATRGCYAAPLNDCDGGPLTAEHFISTTVLEKLGDRLPFEGLPFIKKGSKEMGIRGLKRKILCSKHNNALTSYDAEAGLLMKTLLAMAQGKKIGNIKFNGHNIERWLLKILFGMGASDAIAIKGTPIELAADRSALKWLFDPSLVTRHGLYILDLSQNFKLKPKKELEITPWSNGTPMITGVLVKMARLGLFFGNQPFLSTDTTIKEIHRPARLLVPNKGNITFEWSMGLSPHLDVLVELKPR